jgi:hypothetical protein
MAQRLIQTGIAEFLTLFLTAGNPTQSSRGMPIRVRVVASAVASALVRAFRPRKLPGWFISILGLIERLLLWDDRIRLAYDATRELGGEPALLVNTLLSPWTGMAMIAAGLAYVVFVGEPEHGVQRHRWWPMVGWSVFALCATWIIIALGYGLLELYVREQVAIRGSPVWQLTEGQRENLGGLLDQKPQAERFDVKFAVLIGSTQSQTYGNDLEQVLLTHHWTATGGMDTNMRPDLLGLNLCVPPEIKAVSDAPANMIWFGNVLAQAGIKFGVCSFNMPKGEFMVLVGSRPPN